MNSIRNRVEEIINTKITLLNYSFYREAELPPLLLHFKIYKIYKLYFWFIYGKITINLIYVNNISRILSNIL